MLGRSVLLRSRVSCRLYHRMVEAKIYVPRLQKRGCCHMMLLSRCRDIVQVGGQLTDHFATFDHQQRRGNLTTNNVEEPHIHEVSHHTAMATFLIQILLLQSCATPQLHLNLSSTSKAYQNSSSRRPRSAVTLGFDSQHACIYKNSHAQAECLVVTVASPDLRLVKLDPRQHSDAPQRLISRENFPPATNKAR